jgi:8-oxo-dGTP pyrophosphatase MutT (NUDIX family)
MAEIVDVVNPEDEVIDQASKEKCHREGLIHRGAVILVFRDDNLQEILLQKRSSNVAIKPGKWGLTGGHVMAGESYEEAAKREFSEELYQGSDVDPELEKLFKLKRSMDGDHQHVTVFRTVNDGDFDLFDEEVGEVVFKDIDELLDHTRKNAGEYTDAARLLIQEYDDRERKA